MPNPNKEEIRKEFDIFSNDKLCGDSCIDIAADWWVSKVEEAYTLGKQDTVGEVMELVKLTAEFSTRTDLKQAIVDALLNLEKQLKEKK